MEQDGPFDRRLRRLRRDRAAAGGDADSFYLHRLAADELLDRLDLVKRDFRRGLALGCGESYLAERLRGRGIEMVEVDPGRGFAAAADGIQCDEDHLPFAEGAFDLIVSIGALDSVNDLPGALLLIRRALAPDGLFLAAFAGAGSLPRLKSAMLAADATEGGASPRVHPQIDVRAAGDLLSRAGFALPVVDTHGLDVRFGSFGRLVGDLRAMGTTNLLKARARRPIGRVGLAAAVADFESGAEADGKVRERIEILHLLGWSPSPDQPKPARRGSATFSLSEALRSR